jgi:hypothetical protein
MLNSAADVIQMFITASQQKKGYVTIHTVMILAQ